MKAIFTGMNGTVAPVTAQYFKEEGYTIKAYDRTKISTEDWDEVYTFLKTEAPDMLLHFALGTVEWTKMLAEACKSLHIKYVFISTVNVYGSKQNGPYTVDTVPEPDEEYGRYKHESELISKKVNADTTIIRLGWQIGTSPKSNNMIDFFDKEMSRKGVIHASTEFYPSTSFLEDTGRAIYHLCQMPNDVYLVNSNQSMSFYAIACQLKTKHPFIRIEQTDDVKADKRMIDERVVIPSIKSHF